MSDQVKIYYIPIGAETYVPITIDNIENYAQKTCVLDYEDRTVRKVLRLLSDSSSDGIFDEQKIRVKIILPTNIVTYVDNYGGIRSTDYVTKKMSDATRTKVTKLLEKAC